MFTLSELKKITFSKSTMGGYKTQEVDDFMTDIVGDYAALLSEKNELSKRISELSQKVEEYHQEEENIKAALVTAQQLHNKTVKTAESEAEIIRQETKAKVESLIDNAKEKAIVIVNEAKNQAKEILESARTESTEIIDKTKLQCEKEEKRYEVMKSLVGKFRNETLDNYKKHIELLQKLPDLTEEKSEKDDFDNDDFVDISTGASFTKEVLTEENENANTVKIEDVLENVQDTFTDEDDYSQTDETQIATQEQQDVFAEVSGETIVFSRTDIKDELEKNDEEIEMSYEKPTRKTMAEKFAEIGELNEDDMKRKKFGKKARKEESKQIIDNIKENAQDIKSRIEESVNADTEKAEKVSFEADDGDELDDIYSDGFSVDLDSIEDEEQKDEGFHFFKGN